MKKSGQNSLSLLIGNLWVPKADVIADLRAKNQLPEAQLTSISNKEKIKSDAEIREINPVAIIEEEKPLSSRVLDKENKAEKNIVSQGTPVLNENSQQITQPVTEKMVLIDNWQELEHQIINCQKCKLCYGRKNVVIDRGKRNARWMFIGEGPGEQEDIQGKPFVGASGQLLDKMITAMQLSPENDVYIANVVKCRPPNNRNPNEEEIAACSNYLLSQIAMLKPDIIITLGRFAIQTLLKTTLAVGKLRNKVNYYQDTPVIATYHPSYLLRTPEAKKDAWADLQLAMKTFVK
jgi:DNA polymerase